MSFVKWLIGIVQQWWALKLIGKPTLLFIYSAET